MAKLQAGASVVSITPPLGNRLAGFFYERLAETVADELTARVVVLDDGTTRLSLVVCDLISLRAETVAAAQTAITERCGISASNVMIACTHTHTGPVTADHRDMAADQAYLA
jgi:hypothetical protein